ncbi:MAG: ubiquinol-cytochrome C chaperone family protein [Rhodospirillales bacterium]|nr:ubiquinol-cytochrome C chaperone family protein [Rhodospirillales bacterium]
MSALRKLFDFFGAGRLEAPARGLYLSLVAQARQPGFYLQCGVPDTVDGRFDMILLHAFLVLRRLKRDHSRTADLAQALFDLMFADMDRNLREMGVGDLAVGRRVKAMAAAFYGRIAAYEAGLDAGDATLAEALKRNLYRKANPDAAAIDAVAAYLRREALALDGQPLAGLMAGAVTFGPPPAAPVAGDDR